MEQPEKLLFVKVDGEVRQQKETTMETMLFFVTQLLSSNPLDWNLLVLAFSVETLLANLTKVSVLLLTCAEMISLFYLTCTGQATLFGTCNSQALTLSHL
jgi:hypothetical protein